MRIADTLLFDLDGTLTDPREGIIHSFIYALQKLGFQPAEPESYTCIIGPPLVDSFMKICGIDRTEALRGLGYYREYFSAGGMFENRPYAGIHELLDKAKKAGYSLMVATGKPDQFSEAILKKFDLWEYFDFLAASTMDEKRTTKEEVVAYALSENALTPERTLMIGDRKYDILGAHHMGLKAVGVTYGYGSRQELLWAHADWLCDSIGQLGQLFQLT